MLVGLVRQIVKDLDSYGEDELVRIGSALIDLTAAALPASDYDRPQETHRRTLLQQIHAFIGERIGDADLSPRVIAAAHHISVRYLHMLFESQDATVASTIRRRRLEQCRRDLADPLLLALPVSSIGARSGFNDPSLFSRVFRKQHGVTPGEFRRICLQRGSLRGLGRGTSSVFPKHWSPR